jgi:hypothetical protein
MYTMEDGPVRTTQEAATGVTEVLVSLTGTQLIEVSNHPLCNLLAAGVTDMANTLVLLGAPEDKIGHWLICIGAMMTHTNKVGCQCASCRAAKEPTHRR